MNTKRRYNKRNRFSIVLPILTIVGIGIITVISSFYEESWTYNWSGIRENIRDSIKIAEYRGITSGVGGNGRSSLDEVLRRRWIMHNASESELIRLINYPSGTVKAIAYEGLIRKKDYVNKTELVLKSMKGTIYYVDYQSGCLVSRMELSEYLIQNVLKIDPRIPLPPPDFIDDYGISELEKGKILMVYNQRSKK